MGNGSDLEIERKFLVDNDFSKWKNVLSSCNILHIEQYYISSGKSAFRVSKRNDDYLVTAKTISGDGTGLTRIEKEALINRDAFDVLKALAHSVLIKDRYLYPHNGKVWEIDFFKYPDIAFSMAEVELTSEKEEYEIPEEFKHLFIREVTGDELFFNYRIAKSIKGHEEWK